jgi:ribonuclease H / adenosylcobalamin/alpha-ribazole phosphatase
VSRRLVVEADGGSRGNPGPAGYGAVVRDADTGEVLAERAASIGRATNNVAEYQGLLAGLRAALELEPAAVEVRMDSKLVVEQMSGRWQVKHPDLKPLHGEGRALARALPAVKFGWIPREKNSYADRLANEAMDAAARGQEWSPRRPARVDLGAADEPGRSAARSTDPVAADPVAADSGAAPRAFAYRQDAGPPTTLLLVRHGSTPMSGVRYSGRADPELNTQGYDQARAVAARLAYLAGGDVAVVSSPLTRTRQTATPIAAALRTEVAIDDGLVETDFGRWDGRTFAEVAQEWPAEREAWLADPAVAPPGGESINQVARRVRRSRDRLLAAYPGRTVVVVSHVTPIKLLVCAALGAPSSALFRLHLDTAGLSTVDWFADGQAVVRHVNDTSHLD